MSDEPTVEQRAKEMGWSPKEDFRGAPENWIDAETFVKRGEELMPILRANNKKLTEKLHSVEDQLNKTQTLLKASAESIEALKEFNSKKLREEAKEKKEELVTAIKAAREEGDVEAEVNLTQQLTKTNAAIEEAEAVAPAPKKEIPAADATQSAEWKEWVRDNEWFGPDKRKTALALGIADELRANGSSLKGRAFLDAVSAELDKTLGVTSNRSNISKVEEGGRNGSGEGGKGGKSFADLPPDARAACDRQAGRLVGEGRAFKTQAEWRKHYADKYFEEA